VSNFVKQNLTSYFSNVDKYIEGKILSQKMMSPSEKLEFYNNSRNNFINSINSETMYTRLKDYKYQIIKHSYAEVSSGLHSTHFDSNFSGTTAVSVFMVGNKIICFNAGDSRAILVNSNSNSSNLWI